uniref:Uncharacterized protein n=1 Tax=Leersia perrieri TaxID=77586 RepID=A0A0D9XYN1_9ORYZ
MAGGGSELRFRSGELAGWPGWRGDWNLEGGWGSEAHRSVGGGRGGEETEDDDSGSAATSH